MPASAEYLESEILVIASQPTGPDCEWGNRYRLVIESEGFTNSCLSVHSTLMTDKSTAIQSDIPTGLHPYFQEYNVATLDHKRNSNLIIQRTLEFGT